LPAHDESHEEIARLEEHIEELYAKIENCRKFILASRIAVAGGGLALAAMFVGAIRSISALWQRRSLRFSEALSYGVQNDSTAKEATKKMAAAELDRSALIEQINPRVIQ
jgi:hypothetical protein